MQLFVKSSAKTLALNVENRGTVESVKLQLQTALGVEAVDQMLTFDGRVLEDLCTLEDYSVAPESTLTLTVPVKGGKVHGSLARAGKVRGQTPKVEKQEKKKRPTGRAKRRMQYNRR